MRGQFQADGGSFVRTLISNSASSSFSSSSSSGSRLAFRFEDLSAGIVDEVLRSVSTVDALLLENLTIPRSFPVIPII